MKEIYLPNFFLKYFLWQYILFRKILIDLLTTIRTYFFNTKLFCQKELLYGFE